MLSTCPLFVVCSILACSIPSAAGNPDRCDAVFGDSAVGATDTHPIGPTASGSHCPQRRGFSATTRSAL